MATTVSLNKLKFGDDFPGGSINARKTKSEEGLAELGATILDKGLISPLIVKTLDGKVYVSEGNRRLKAMRMLVKEGKIPKDWPVKIDELAEGVDPLEASLTANIMQLPMHEVDRFETFAKLASAGKTADDIASSFGTSVLVVRRALALGRISPVLRDAWRKGDLTADAAKAFSIVTDHALQEQAYTSLARAQNLHRYAITKALHVNEVSSDLDFVGREAYLAAGGRLSEDLFADGICIMDDEILKRLDREKIDRECRRLLDEGWGWAALDRDLPHDRWRWRRRETAITYTEQELCRLEELRPLLDVPCSSSEAFRKREEARVEVKRIEGEAALRSFTDEDRAASGCVLSRFTGRLEIQFGIQRPSDQAASASDRDAEDGSASSDASQTGDEPGVSRALAQSLSEQLTTAAATALLDEPDMALRVLVAALQVRSRAPVRVHIEGMNGLLTALKNAEMSSAGQTFAEALELTKRSRQAYLMAELAMFVAAALDLTDGSRDHPAKSVTGQQQLVDALDPAGYLAAARKAFDADGYFDRAPASVAIDAIAEMGGPKPSSKKGVVALAAATLARDLGWLPAKLRSCHYVAPLAEDNHRPTPVNIGAKRNKPKVSPSAEEVSP